MFSKEVFTRGTIKSDKTDHFLALLPAVFLAAFLAGETFLAAFLGATFLGATFLAGAAFLATVALTRARKNR